MLLYTAFLGGTALGLALVGRPLMRRGRADIAFAAAVVSAFYAFWFFRTVLLIMAGR
ncbi:hypothetical protein Aple_010440 [Acrocarpospora pleiomorpha]|uniref:Uncharacterized protein n=1 Tax=Acrocarpospora pleiomorpha TaxID=90975 RepID=A0A5M3XD77_9ACTN|nr:hypothetical protein [Acrocarpospora pleiomorpha]GES18149.1 hypothetical protein Aple_010440 [Acrocarpospora pleiomorpha]